MNHDEFISQGMVEKLRSQLPPEYEPLLSAGSAGTMRVQDRR